MTTIQQCSTLKGSRGKGCFGQSLRGGARVWHSRRAAVTATSSAAGAGAGTEPELKRVLRYPDGYERTIRYPVESTNTGPAIAERFMWPMHMHMEERRAQLPAELAGAQLMTGSTSNFQEMEAEQAEEQQEEEAGPAQAAAAMALQRQWEREATQPAPTTEEEAEDETDMPVTAAAFLRWASSEQQQQAREHLLQAARDAYEVHRTSPYDADCPPRSLVVLSRLSADGGSAQLFTMRTRAENSALEDSLDGLLKPRADGATVPRIVVNDMRDGVLAFEDEDEALRYAETLEAEETYGEVDTATVDAAQLFELTAGSSALVVLFRQDKMAPEPSTLLSCLKGADTGLEEFF